MHNLLIQFLDKHRIKDEDKLNDVDRRNFDKWRATLERQVGPDDIKAAIEASLDKLQTELYEEDIKNPLSYLFFWKRDIELKARIQNLRMLRKLFEANERNKKAMEKYIKELLHSKNL